jgi:hypothetical protein
LATIPLAFVVVQSDESSCATDAQKRMINMTNAETTDKPATVAEQGTAHAAEPTASKKGASKKHGASTGQKSAKGAKRTAQGQNTQAKAGKKASKKANAAANDKPKAERSNKKAEVIAMMKRSKGVTLAEIMKATGWQNRPARGQGAADP